MATPLEEARELVTADESQEAPRDASVRRRTPPSRGRARLAFFAILVVAIVVVDQVVKRWIVAGYEVGVPVQVAGDWIRIVLGHNTGGLFGLFQDQARIFAVLSVAVMAAIVGYEVVAGAGSTLLTVALGLLLGGAIGNFIDRQTLGYVRDFVDLGIGTWRWYVFNVADASISLAILLLLLVAILPQRLPERGGAPAVGAPDTQQSPGPPIPPPSSTDRD